MRKLLLSVVALFAMSAQNAFAINLTFQFDVNSSGPSIYACNAGIKHAKSPNVCYDSVNAVRCSSACAGGDINACTAESSTPASCVCTGEANTGGNDGTWRLDYLNANTAPWTDNQTAMGTTTPYQISANGTDGYAQIYSSTIAGQPANSAYENQLKDLSINLGSEIYNAQYFVDICYRGPQIDYRNNGTTVSGLNFGLKARSTVINILDAKGNKTDYVKHSGLKVRATAKCIMDDEFNYCNAGSLPGVDIGCGQAAGSYYNYDAANEIVGPAKDNDGFVPVAEVSTTAKLIEDQAMRSTKGGHVTPRFCQIRYEFKETNMTAIRKWKLQQARICTYTEITEGTKK